MPTADYVRTFNRFEYKYLVRVETMRLVAEALDGYAVPDPHSDPERGYPVHSLYWDSAELGFFWEKIDGQKYRRKLRFRRYGGSGPAYVEIKQRIDRSVQKRRVQMAPDDIARLFGRGHIDSELESAVVDPVAQEALFLCRRYDLRPTMAVLYRRLAFHGVFEHDLRITFDTRVQYDPRAMDIRETFETGKYAVDPRLAVMEIKFNHAVPQWLLALAARHQIELVRFSKYCAAIDREVFGGRFT
jgi:SPX domain protein involved in polyphosphate accumulation